MATTNLEGSINIRSKGGPAQYLIDGVPISGGGSSASLGWEFVLDTEYPDADNGFSVDADTWVRLPCNGFVIPGVTNLPDGVSSFYNAGDQKVEVDEGNSFFTITAFFGIRPVASNASVAIRSLIDSVPPTNAYGPETKPLSVDAGVSNVLFIRTLLPVTANSLANGTYYEINCSSDCEIFQAGYLIEKGTQK